MNTSRVSNHSINNFSGNGNMDALDELRKLIECPICYEELIPPIETCENGHGICTTCRKSLDKCALCSKKFTLVKNTLLNQMVANLGMKCKFHTFGCSEVVIPSKIFQHESTCRHRLVQCILCNKEKIPLASLNDHLAVEEKDRSAYFAKAFLNRIIRIRSDGKKVASFSISYVKHNDSYFGIRYRVDWDKKMLWVCVINTDNDSTQYMYTVTLKENLSAKNKCLLKCNGPIANYFYGNTKVEPNPATVYFPLNPIFFNNLSPAVGFIMSVEIKQIP